MNENEKRKIAIFDLDDTLVVTEAKIRVLNKIGKELTSLTPAQFNSFTKKRHHVLNFEDFDSGAILKEGKMIASIFAIFRTMLMKGEDISIITGRSSKKLVLDFFLDKGIRLRNDLVFAVNDPSCTFTGSVAERKKQAIEVLVNKGYNDFIFFDDHIDNLTLAKELEKEKGVIVETVHVT